MPKQINTYTFGQALVRKFGLKGRFQPVLDETIVPVTVVDSDLATRRAAGGMFGTASGVGKQNWAIMTNPTGSGVIVTIQKWWAISGTPATDFVSIETENATSSVTGQRLWRDQHLPGTPKAGFANAQVASAVLTGPQYSLIDPSRVWEEEWILPEGWRLIWKQNEQNDTLNVWLDWIETSVVATVS